MNDQTLKREDRDWKLFVADFPDDQFGEGVRLHVKPGTWLKAKQHPKHADDAAYVTVEFGPHCTLFLSHYQARRLHEELAFSAGVPTGVPLLPAAASVSDLSPLTAPAEPPQPTRPDPGLSEAWLTGKSDIRNPSEAS